MNNAREVLNLAIPEKNPHSEIILNSVTAKKNNTLALDLKIGSLFKN